MRTSATAVVRQRFDNKRCASAAAPNGPGAILLLISFHFNDIP